MIVVDAGALVEVVLRSQAGRRIQRMVVNDDAYAPDLIDAEAFAVLARAARRGLITGTDLRERVELVRVAAIERLSSRSLMAVATAFTASLSGYDALYVAAADALACGIVTTDGGLATTAADQFGITVTHVPATNER